MDREANGGRHSSKRQNKTPTNVPIRTSNDDDDDDDADGGISMFSNPIKKGWLDKQGGKVKTWKRRWFVLNGNCLYYFEFTADKEPKGIIPLENVEVKEVETTHGPHCFEIYPTSAGNPIIKSCKTDSLGRVIEGQHYVYKLSAYTSRDKDDWIRSLRASIIASPAHEVSAAEHVAKTL
jgi:cytohesin